MKRLSKKQMIIFAIGQFGWSLLSGIISAWLVTYYLPTGGETGDIAAGASQFILPGLVIGGFMTVLGLITALSRVFDAVTDPLIASLSDRSKNPRGRRMPFMMVAAIPLAIVTVLLFCATFGKYDAGGNVGNIIWISVAIVLFYLFMTMYCTPYNALISEFGKSQEDRMFISTSISLTFFAGTLIAYLPFVFAGASMVKKAGTDVIEYQPKVITSLLLNNGMGREGAFAWSFRICFIVLAVIAAVAMLLPAFLLKEKNSLKPNQVKKTLLNHSFQHSKIKISEHSPSQTLCTGLV